jgi:hypothetical protein
MTSENRRDMEKVAIEKPVTPLARPGTEQPAGLLSAKPLATVPTTATAMGPNTVGKPGTMPTPLASPISPNVKAELGKLGSEKAGRVRDVVSRK